MPGRANGGYGHFGGRRSIDFCKGQRRIAIETAKQHYPF
jgi:hypothetical protein